MWLVIHLLLPLFLLTLCKKNKKKPSKTPTVEKIPSLMTISPEIRSRESTPNESKEPIGERSKMTTSETTTNSEAIGGGENAEPVPDVANETPAMTKQSLTKLKKENAGVTPRRLVKGKSRQSETMEAEPTQKSEVEEVVDQKKNPATKKACPASNDGQKNVMEGSYELLGPAKSEAKCQPVVKKTQSEAGGQYESLGPGGTTTQPAAKAESQAGGEYEALGPAGTTKQSATKQSATKPESQEPTGGQYESLGPVGSQASKDRSVYDEAGSTKPRDETKENKNNTALVM